MRILLFKLKYHDSWLFLKNGNSWEILPSLIRLAFHSVLTQPDATITDIADFNPLIRMAFHSVSGFSQTQRVWLFPKYRLARSAVGDGVTAVGNLFTKDRGTNSNTGQSPQPIRFSIFFLSFFYNIIGFPAMGTLGFDKIINLKPGVFLLSFSMLLFRSCKQASNASLQPWKSILSECESPL